jgi:hypothetical protein
MDFAFRKDAADIDEGSTNFVGDGCVVQDMGEGS